MAAKVCTAAMMSAAVVTDVGDKYVQHYDPDLTPTNVVPQAASAHLGNRMEDVASVETLPNGAQLIVVADGHGASSMVSQSRDRECILVGGYEAAALAVAAVRAYINGMADSCNFACLPDDGVSIMMSHAFRYAQTRLEQETERGCDEVEHPLGAGHPASRSLIDGWYFGHHRLATGAALPGERWRVVKKVKRAVRPTQPAAVFYVTSDGVEVPCEHGCTMTVALIVPLFSGQTAVFVAHAGDSAAVLYHAGGFPERLTGDHTTANNEEKTRMARHGMHKEGRYFVLDDRDTGLRSKIMPSRSLGHSFLSHFGVTWIPEVKIFRMREGDVLVVASDGLWDAHGTQGPYHVARIVQRQRHDMESLARALCQHALSADDHHDNIAIVTARLMTPDHRRQPPTQAANPTAEVDTHHQQ
jgi:serine/threonine protein phosphatase PrpC